MKTPAIRRVTRGRSRRHRHGMVAIEAVMVTTVFVVVFYALLYLVRVFFTAFLNTTDVFTTWGYG
jgi:hypothetical protein